MTLPIIPSFMSNCCSQFDLFQQIELPDVKVHAPPNTHSILLNEVKLKLQNQELWEQFYAETTEMIITKVGRRMFPHLLLTVTGLQEHLDYCIFVEMKLVSPYRHKYCGNSTLDENENKTNSRGWTKAGQAETQPNLKHRIYSHPESPAHGIHWMRHVVSFNKLKVTNNTSEHGSNVLLTSMHKYIPRIWIIQSNQLGDFKQLLSQPHVSFTFKETEFIAVTAYQNDQITKLKINNNPFAKGFRETGHSKYKRKHEKESANHSNQTNDEDSNSSFETSPSFRRQATMMLRRTDALHNVTHTNAIDRIKLSSPMITPAENLPPRAENNHLNERPSTLYHRFHRPWVDTPDPPEINLPSRPLPLLSPPTLSNLSLYNYQFLTPSLLHRNFIPTFSHYHPFIYPNIYNSQYYSDIIYDETSRFSMV